MNAAQSSLHPYQAPANLHSLKSLLQQAISCYAGPKHGHTLIGKEGQTFLLVDGRQLLARCMQAAIRLYERNASFPAPPELGDTSGRGLVLAWTNFLRWCVRVMRVRISPTGPVSISQTATLPSSRVLTTCEKEVWDALEDRILSSPELSKELLGHTSYEVAIRKRIQRIRIKGFKIESIKGRGYYRPEC